MCDECGIPEPDDFKIVFVVSPSTGTMSASCHGCWADATQPANDPDWGAFLKLHSGCRRDHDWCRDGHIIGKQVRP